MALAEMIHCSTYTQRASHQPYPAFLKLSHAGLLSTPATEKSNRVSDHEISPAMEESQQSQSGFFELPAELRLHIYELCVSPIKVQSPFDHRFKKVNAVKYRVPDFFLLPVLFADSSFPLSLLLSSKRMASEAIDAIYRLVSFELITTHSTYMFAYNYYLTRHPMRYTEQLTLRIVHDIWSSRRYEAVPRLRPCDWTKLSSLISDMPNLRRLTIRIFHNSQNDDVDFTDESGRRGMNELAEGMKTIQTGLSTRATSTTFEVEFAAPKSDYVDPAQRDRLMDFLKTKDLPVVGGNCSWVKVSTQDNGAYIWNPAGWAGGVAEEAVEGEEGEKPTEWA